MTQKSPIDDEITRLMQSVVDRELAHIGVLRGSVGHDVLTLRASEPGVLQARDGVGRVMRVGFYPVLRLLEQIPNDAGMGAVRSKVLEAIGAGGIRPPRRPDAIQPGDRLGSGVVDGILLGANYQSAKNGDPIDAVRWDFLAEPRNAERVIVTLRDGQQSYWRRGTQISRDGAVPARIEQKITMRRLYQQASRALWSARSRVHDFGAGESKYRDLSQLCTRLGHLLAGGSEARSSLEEERLLLRRRVRDIRGEERLLGIHLALSMREERDECRARLADIGRMLRADRLQASTARP